MPTSTPARVAIRRITDLAPDDWTEISRFGSRYFEGNFVEGIRSKQDLVQLRGDDGRLLGIGAVDIFDLTHEGRTVTVIFAGNAAFADETRGQGYVQRIGFRYFLRAKRRHPRRPVYVAFGTFSWLSYLSLTRNFRCFWPRQGTRTPDWEAGLLGLIGSRSFGERYEPDSCVARNGPRRLRPDISTIPHHMASDPDVAYFAARNAGYTSGDVMMCLAPLTVSNWWYAASRIVRRRLRRLAAAQGAGGQRKRPLWRLRG